MVLQRAGLYVVGIIIIERKETFSRCMRTRFGRVGRRAHDALEIGLI